MNKIVRTETRKRGFFGNIFKWTFILFNIAMVFWLFSYLGLIGDKATIARNDFETAGTLIGGTIGTGIIVSFWVSGDIILGLFVLFTRGQKIIIEEAIS